MGAGTRAFPARWHEALRAAGRAYDAQATREDVELLAVEMAPFVAMVRERLPALGEPSRGGPPPLVGILICRIRCGRGHPAVRRRSPVLPARPGLDHRLQQRDRRVAVPPAPITQRPPVRTDAVYGYVQRADDDLCPPVSLETLEVPCLDEAARQQITRASTLPRPRSKAQRTGRNGPKSAALIH